MAKPILYYVLIRHSFGRDFWVMGVTSEKGRQVYGRDHNDAVTHVSAGVVLHRSPEGTTAEFAHAARDRASAEHAKHATGIRMARAEVSRLEEVRYAAVLRAAKGEA